MEVRHRNVVYCDVIMQFHYFIILVCYHYLEHDFDKES